MERRRTLIIKVGGASSIFQGFIVCCLLDAVANFYLVLFIYLLFINCLTDLEKYGHEQVALGVASSEVKFIPRDPEISDFGC